MKEVIKTILAALLIISIIVIVILGHIAGDISYNNGTCKECGGHFILLQSIAERVLNIMNVILAEM